MTRKLQRAAVAPVPDAGRLRVDKWLWAARFFKTRSLATEAVDLGRVRLDGRRIKPAHELRVGDRLEIVLGEQRIELQVRALSDLRGPAPVARQLYEESPESAARRARHAEGRRFGVEPAQTLRGRPTKRDGRELRRVGHRGDE